ncbi:hypothetical protein WN943_022090 [Citrus x changshan-huyou]
MIVLISLPYKTLRALKNLICFLLSLVNMASKFSNSFLLLRRSNAVAAGNVGGKQPAAAEVMRKMTDMKAESVCGVEKEEFWMRDPNTGNWIPESQFNQIDAADLRDQLLPKIKKNDS